MNIHRILTPPPLPLPPPPLGSDGKSVKKKEEFDESIKAHFEAGHGFHDDE